MAIATDFLHNGDKIREIKHGPHDVFLFTIS